jgi:hypothetical protein
MLLKTVRTSCSSTIIMTLTRCMLSMALALAFVTQTLQRPVGSYHSPEPYHVQNTPHSMNIDEHGQYYYHIEDHTAHPYESSPSSASKKKSTRRGSATSYPPPLQQAHSLDLIDYVKQKQNTFAARGSEPWISLASSRTCPAAKSMPDAILASLTRKRTRVSGNQLDTN